MFGLKPLQCKGVKKAGWRYLDDTLPSGKRTKIQKHLTACVNCRTEYTRRMGILEALRQGMPIDTTLVHGVKSSGRRLLRLALTGVIMILVFAAGWYALSGSDLGTQLASWKTNIAGILTTLSSAEIEEKTTTGLPPENTPPPEPQPFSLPVSPPAASPPSTASIRAGQPGTEAVMQPVNSEPRTQSSLGKIKGGSKQSKAGNREQGVENGKERKTDLKDPNRPARRDIPKSEGSPTRNLNSPQIQVYDESGQLIKSERVKAGGQK